ncbi:MAG: metallophosphoesterase [Planctomycetota bacterium]
MANGKLAHANKCLLILVGLVILKVCLEYGVTVKYIAELCQAGVAEMKINRREMLKKAGLGLGAWFLSGGISSADKPKHMKTPMDEILPGYSDVKSPLLFVPGSWTLVVLPDTQKYAQDYPGILHLQTQWVKDNKEKYNIRYVFQNGDIVNKNIKLQWQRVSDAFAKLDGLVPYAIAPGNHDYTVTKSKVNGRNKLFLDRGSSLINDYFPPSRLADWPTFGGVMEKGRLENTYHKFEAGGEKWLIINLEWAPRDEALEWAGKILKKFRDHKAIIQTHAYLYSDSTRYDFKKKGFRQHYPPHTCQLDGTKNDGEEMWQKLVKKHPNVCMTINGHVVGPDENGKITPKSDALGFLVSKGDHGNLVFQILVNFQHLPLGGGGWLQLIEFLPDGQTVQVKNYSPFYDKYNTGREDQFSFKMPLRTAQEKKANLKTTHFY